MQEHPKPLRDSTAYEMGRSAAAAGRTLLAPSEFEQAHSGYDLTTDTYHYYWRGYTTWHKERDADIRIGRCAHGALAGFCTHEDCGEEVRFPGPTTYTEACTCGGWERGFHRHDCGVFGGSDSQ